LVVVGVAVVALAEALVVVGVAAVELAAEVEELVELADKALADEAPSGTTIADNSNINELNLVAILVSFIITSPHLRLILKIS
jgi:hypothetical protein